MSKKRIVLVDALALAYKGYFAFINRPLSNSKGEPTSAVFGFMSQFFRIIEKLKPQYVAVAFDSREKTFRHEMYEGYKSSRSEMPDDMVPQLGRIKEIIEAFNIPIVIKPGLEADDLIGIIANDAEQNEYEVYCVTPDKDYVQLVTENIKIAKAGKNDDLEIIDVEKTKEIYGFGPEYMVDYLALIGDKSDDIPGVKGIGEKSATPLIQQFGSLEDIYNNIENIEKKGVQTKLLNDKENAFLSKKLATIVKEDDYEYDLKRFVFNKPDIEKLLAIFSELELKYFPERLVKFFDPEMEMDIEEPEDTTNVFDESNTDYKLVVSETDVKKLVNILEKNKWFVFDTETDGLDTFVLNLAGASFSIKEKEAWFVPVDPETDREGGFFQTDLSDRLSITKFVELFKPLFENENVGKICQNGKYDIAVLRKYNINVTGFTFDTMLASYVIDPDVKHGMDELAKSYLNYETIPLTAVIESKKTPEKVFEADLKTLTNYACEDADITLRLYNKLNEVIKEEKLEKIAYDIEFPLVPVLEDIERTGIKLNISKMKELSNELDLLLINYTKNIYDIAGEEFNINSTQQLQKILFDKLGLPNTKKTKTGYSTDARSLESLKGKHDIVDILLDYRQYTKLKSTYTDSLPKLVNPLTGKIHTTFNQTVASTGRLSSNDPNLQNIPIRTEYGKKIREAFIPTDDNHTLLSADYSQIELRIMASICGDENLMKAFIDGEDIHRSTAAKVFQVSPDEVTSDMRRKAKEVNFGILYGIGPFGLKTRLGITQKHAKEIIDTYFETFSKVKGYIESSIEQSREKGYAETLLGRRRYLKNINSKNNVVRSGEERIAINMPIQGSAADMIKLAMINVFNRLNEKNLKSKIVLQVHDELVLDVLKEELDEVTELVVKGMEEAMPLNVPVKVEYGTGDNWLVAH